MSARAVASALLVASGAITFGTSTEHQVAAQQLMCLTNSTGLPMPGVDQDADHFRDVEGCDWSAIPEAGSNDPDVDDDGVQDGIEYGAGTDIYAGSYPPGIDTDGDGCLNEVELAADDLEPNRDRHPGNWWDNWDVNASGDVDLSDTLIVLSYFGREYLGNGEYSGARGQELDRVRLTAPGPPGLVVEGNDGIDLSESLQNLFQFGWGGCSAPGPVPPEGGGVYD